MADSFAPTAASARATSGSKELADADGIRDAEDGAEAAADAVLGDHEVGQQLDLLQLLVEGHLPQQALDPLLDRPVRRPSGGAECRLVGRGVRRGDRAGES
jgi:hypothetical protein